METLLSTTLIAATMTTGIAAGVYLLYSFVIMPGLKQTNDHTFVGAFQQIDKVIVGPFLLVFFFGPIVLTATATALSFGTDEQTALPWIGAALVLCLAIAVVTLVVNVPLNNTIDAAGEPDEIADIAGVRERFRESRWVASNNIRVVASTVAPGCLAWALVLHERT